MANSMTNTSFLIISQASPSPAKSLKHELPLLILSDSYVQHPHAPTNGELGRDSHFFFPPGVNSSIEFIKRPDQGQNVFIHF